MPDPGCAHLLTRCAAARVIERFRFGCVQAIAAAWPSLEGKGGMEDTPCVFKEALDADMAHFL